jgi:hypothetical protein
LNCVSMMFSLSDDSVARTVGRTGLHVLKPP